jgi:hypothetical protein
LRLSFAARARAAFSGPTARRYFKSGSSSALPQTQTFDDPQDAMSRAHISPPTAPDDQER